MLRDGASGIAHLSSVATGRNRSHYCMSEIGVAWYAVYRHFSDDLMYLPSQWRSVSMSENGADYHMLLHTHRRNIAIIHNCLQWDPSPQSMEQESPFLPESSTYFPGIWIPGRTSILDGTRFHSEYVSDEFFYIHSLCQYDQVVSQSWKWPPINPAVVRYRQLKRTGMQYFRNIERWSR